MLLPSRPETPDPNFQDTMPLQPSTRLYERARTTMKPQASATATSTRPTCLPVVYSSAWFIITTANALLPLD
ncbi:hypothetical protein C8Q73DRAFT_284496 [Cubamyces lactineus]|nr:hypothetical protein C8Q73DRAFT_284496 [Cubamyces lactineus]